MKLYIFRTVRLSVIRSLFTVHSAMVYVIQVCRPVWHVPLLSVRWINSCWRTDELSETCRVTWQNKFVKLVHLVGFIIKKFVTMQHGHMSRCMVTCYDAARSHVTMHSHMSLCTVTCYNAARSHVTMQHGHMSRCTVTCHYAQSHVTMQHGHMSWCTVTCYDAARSHVTMQHGYTNVKFTNIFFSCS